MIFMLMYIGMFLPTIPLTSLSHWRQGLEKHVAYSNLLATPPSPFKFVPPPPPRAAKAPRLPVVSCTDPMLLALVSPSGLSEHFGSLQATVQNDAGLVQSATEVLESGLRTALPRALQNISTSTSRCLVRQIGTLPISQALSTFVPGLKEATIVTLPGLMRNFTRDLSQVCSQGCIGRQRTSQAAPEAVRQAVGGGCQSGCGRLLSVTNAIEAGTCRQGDSGWA